MCVRIGSPQAMPCCCCPLPSSQRCFKLSIRFWSGLKQRQRCENAVNDRLHAGADRVKAGQPQQVEVCFVAFAETWNGRLAMLGFVIGLGTELLTGQGILSQIGLG